MINELYNKDIKINTDGDQVRFVQNIIDTVKQGYDEIVDVAFFSFEKIVTLRNKGKYGAFVKDQEDVAKALEVQPEEEKEDVVSTFTTKPTEVAVAPLPEGLDIEVVRKAASKKELVIYLDQFPLQFDSSLGLKKLIASIEALLPPTEEVSEPEEPEDEGKE